MTNISISSFAHFNANKNAVDQTGLTSAAITQITFGTELYDVGGYFASSTWTPPAGRVILTGRVKATGTITAGGTAHYIYIYRDGLRANGGYANFTAMTNQVCCFIGPWEDIATGSTAYTLYASITTSSGTATIVGAVANTMFSGHWVGSL